MLDMTATVSTQVLFEQLASLRIHFLLVLLCLVWLTVLSTYMPGLTSTPRLESDSNVMMPFKTKGAPVARKAFQDGVVGVRNSWAYREQGESTQTPICGHRGNIIGPVEQDPQVVFLATSSVWVLSIGCRQEVPPV